MNKEEYLHELEVRLKKYLSRSEVDDILRDYGEYFEDGRRQNKTDIEISAKLGTPEMIAQQFIEENKGEKKEKYAVELEKMKEKATSTVEVAKEKVKASHPLQSLNKAAGMTYHPLKRLIQFCLNTIYFLFKLGIMAALAFVFIWIFVGLAFFTVFVFGMGVAGLLFSIVTASFISIFFTIAGILASISILCIGALLGMLVFYFVKGIYHIVRKLKSDFFFRKKVGEVCKNV